MASRRARIQIKPNIRPAKPATPAAKAGDTGKSKTASTVKTDHRAESSVESSKSTLKEAAEKKGEKVKSVEAAAPVSHDKTDSSTGADPSPSGEDVSQDVPKASQNGGEEARNVSSFSSSAEVLPFENAALPSPGTAAPADSAVPRPSPVQPAPAVLARQEVSDSQAGKAGSVPAITVTAAGDEPRQEPFPSVRSESPVKRTSGVDMLSDHHDTRVLPSKEGAGVSGTAELSDHAHSKGADHSHPHGKAVDHGRSKSADHVHSKSHDHSHGKSLDHGHSKSLLHAHPKLPDHGHPKASEHGYFRGTDHGAKGPEGIHKGRTEPKRFNVHTIRKRRTPVDKNLLPSTDEPPPKTLKMRELVHWNPKSNPMSSTASVKGKAKKKKGTESSAETAAKVEALNDFDRHLVPPRVKLGPDGNIALDENIFQEQNLMEELPTVEEDENEVLNSHSFRKNRTLTKYWSKRETAKFYIALSMVGTDFTLMQCELFPKRSRKELKNKFKREERSNRNMVDVALKNKQPINKSVFITDEADEEAEKERKKEERERKRQERLEAQQQQRQEREVKKRQSQAEKAQQPTQSQPSEQRKSGRKRRAVQQDDYIFGYEDEEDMELEEAAAPVAKDPRTEVGEILVNMSQQCQPSASPGGSQAPQPLPSPSAPRLSPQKPPSAPPRGPPTPRSPAALPRLAPSILRKTSQPAGVSTATLTTSQGASSSAASTGVEVPGQSWVPSPQYLLSANSSGTITHETRDSAGNVIKIEMPQEALMNIDGARMVDQVIMTPQGPSTQRLLLMPEAKQDNCMVHIYVVPQDATISIFQEVDDHTRQRLMDFPPSSLQPSQSGQMHLYNMAYPNSGGTIKAHVHPFTPVATPAPSGTEFQVAAADHSQQQAAGWPGDGQLVQVDQQFVQVDPSAAHLPVKQEGFVREETVTTLGLPGVDSVDSKQVGSATWGEASVAGTGYAGKTHSALSHEAALHPPSSAASVSSAVQGPSALNGQPQAAVTNPSSRTEEQCNFLLADDPEEFPPCQQESTVMVASGEFSASSKEGANPCLANVPNRTASISEKISLSVASGTETGCNFLLADDPDEKPNSSYMEVHGDIAPVAGQGAWPSGHAAGQEGLALVVKEDMEVKAEEQKNSQADSGLGVSQQSQADSGLGLSQQSQADPSETAASHLASSSQDISTATSPSLR